MSAASLPFLSFHSPSLCRGISLLSFMLSLPVSLSLFLPSLPFYRIFLSLSFQTSRLLLALTSVSLTPIKNVPSTLSSVPSYSLSLFLCFPLGVMYMCNYYYVVVIHVTLRHVQTRLVRVGKMVVFEYNMYPVYPTGWLSVFDSWIILCTGEAVNRRLNILADRGVFDAWRFDDNRSVCHENQKWGISCLQAWEPRDDENFNIIIRNIWH